MIESLLWHHVVYVTNFVRIFQNILFNLLNVPLCLQSLDLWMAKSWQWLMSPLLRQCSSSSTSSHRMLHSDGQWLLQSSSKWSRLGNVACKLHASVHQQHHMHMLSWNSCGLYLGYLANSVHQRHLQKAFVSLSCTAISVGVIFVDFFFLCNLFIYLFCCCAFKPVWQYVVQCLVLLKKKSFMFWIKIGNLILNK